MRGLLAIGASIVIGSGGAGCLRDHAQTCGDVICPATSVCLPERSLCVSPGAAAICEGRPDGAPCTEGELDGSCEDGLCVAAVCGDATVTGSEQCDGAAPQTCADFGFYAGATTCSAGCFYDTSGCSGRCGDGIVQTDAGEICDGATPREGCAAIGYDYGHLACTARCTDTSRLDCGRYTARSIYDAPVGTVVQDVWRDGDLLVVAFGDAGLRVLRAGGEAELAGAFWTIAASDAGVFTSSKRDVYRVDGGVERLPNPPVSPSIAQSFVAAAPAGELWYLTSTCEVASYAAGAWTAQGSPLAIACAGISVTSDGQVYVIASVDGGTRVLRRMGAAWQPVSVMGNPSRLMPGADGTLLALSSAGISVITGGTATLVPGENLIDAAPSAAGLLAVTTTSLLRLGTAPAVLLEPGADGFIRRLRRMRDGTVLGWQRRVFELGAITPTVVETRPILGIETGTIARFVLVTELELVDPTGVYRALFGSRIRDVAVDAQGTIYVATADGLYRGTWGALFVPDRARDPMHVWVSPAGDLAVSDADGAVYTRRAAEPAWTLRRPAGACRPGPLAGPSLDELYVALQCGEHMQIERTSKTDAAVVLELDPLAESAMRGGFRSAITLADGSVAFAGARIAIGRDTAWIAPLVEATAVGGDRSDDLWFAGLRLTPLAADSLGHWNGTDLVALRSPLPSAPAHVAATADTVYVASPEELVGLVRLRGD